MLIVELVPQSNGARRNQMGRNCPVPDGWVQIPAAMEQEAAAYLPFLDLTIENGRVTAVAQGPIPDPAPEPETAPATEDDLMAIAVDHEYRLTLLELGVME